MLTVVKPLNNASIQSHL